MTLRKAIEVLKTHQTWRLGGVIEMIQPKVLTEALDVVLNFTDSPEFGFAESRVEKTYSVEDMNEYADFCSNIVLTKPIGFPFPTPKEWFEQFKK